MASEPIPEGYGEWTAIYSLVGNQRELAVTCGYHNPTDMTTSTVLANLQSAGEAAAPGIFDGVVMNDGYELERLYCLQTRSGILESGTLPVGNTGIQMNASLPVTCSVIIAKNTNRAGRQFRGRFLFPPMFFAESDVGATNEIVGGELTSLQALASAFFNALVINDIPPVLLHSQPKDPLAPIPPPTLITSFSVRTQIGSDRRRLKRFTG